MANPTSNFNWQMPTSSDLVTDLPADFEVFGQAVDTSLADLKGGTTGQVLKKNTNADMDFVWSADAGMTNPMTTTGDTIYSSSGSTPARLGIGSTGQVLTVSGGVPAWTTPAGGKVLQVVGATQSTEVASSSTTFADTNLTATITPSSATSKVLVLFTQPIGRSDANSNQAVLLRLFRGATQLGNTFNLLKEGNFNFGSCVASSAYLDSPATTSATTYKTTFANSVAASQVTANHENATSTMTLLEIGA